MYYKIDVMPDGTLEIVDRVEEKKPDGFIYATENDLKKINHKFVKDYSEGIEL